MDDMNLKHLMDSARREPIKTFDTTAIMEVKEACIVALKRQLKTAGSGHIVLGETMDWAEVRLLDHRQSSLFLDFLDWYLFATSTGEKETIRCLEFAIDLRRGGTKFHLDAQKIDKQIFRRLRKTAKVVHSQSQKIKTYLLAILDEFSPQDCSKKRSRWVYCDSGLAWQNLKRAIAIICNLEDQSFAPGISQLIQIHQDRVVVCTPSHQPDCNSSEFELMACQEQSIAFLEAARKYLQKTTS